MAASGSLIFIDDTTHDGSSRINSGGTETFCLIITEKCIKLQRPSSCSKIVLQNTQFNIGPNQWETVEGFRLVKSNKQTLTQLNMHEEGIKGRNCPKQTTTEGGYRKSLEKQIQRTNSESQAWCSNSKLGICNQIWSFINFNLLQNCLYQYFCSLGVHTVK